MWHNDYNLTPGSVKIVFSLGDAIVGYYKQRLHRPGSGRMVLQIQGHLRPFLDAVAEHYYHLR